MIPVPGSQLGRGSDGADQSVQYLPSLHCLVEEMLSVLPSEIVEVLRDHQLSVDLNQRSSGSSEKIMELVR
jgi:hypothetical protein